MGRRRRSNRQGTIFKRTLGGPWVAQWYDHAGKRKFRSTGTTDRAAAERILAKHVADSALRRDGVIDARADRYAEAEQRPIAAHVADWRAHLDAKGVTPKQVAHVTKRVEALLASMRVDRVSGLVASAVQGAIGEIRKDGKSLQTCQHYLRAIKQFSRWLRADGRVREDALAHLAGFNTATDRRYERRALDADELRWLVETTATAPRWRQSLSGADRAMLYRVAAGTGFRAGELASLTPRNFDLDADTPAIRLEAKSSKRRRADVQPIREDLAATLKLWLADRPATKPVWPGWWRDQAAEMIRADLRRARGRWIRETRDRQERRRRRNTEFLAEVDAAGRVADFHALRVSFITLLVTSGVSVKVAQELARHSPPTLTLGVYTKLGVHDLTGALDALPSLAAKPDAQPEKIAMRATGTDHASADDAGCPAETADGQTGADEGAARDGCRQYCRQSERGRAPSRAARRIVVCTAGTPSAARKSFAYADKGDAVQAGAASGGKATGRIRTDDLRFTKPLRITT